MFAAIASLTLLGLLLGLLLSLAGRFLRVEGDPLTEEVTQMLPGANCGQCGYPGCEPAAKAMVTGDLAITSCPPGGRGLVENLSARLGISVDSNAVSVPQVARVDESLCIGCAYCGKECNSDAIVGTSKHIHTVFQDACNGCGKCIEVCPTECLQLYPLEPTVKTWYWVKPAQAA